jgi:putative transposase
MPEYRRSWVEGGTFFFTVVTYHRRPILTTTEARKILRSAWVDVRKRFPFTVDAVCLLPDHLHCIWVLPEGDANYAVRWKEIKRLFTRSYLDRVGPGEARNASRESRGEAAIWQRRYWEHTLRDEADLNRHRDYIHYNPVKHGLVRSVADWPWSSFHRYVRLGYYDRGWGEAVEQAVSRMRYGE